MTKSYVPERGDLVWLDFAPTRGHEQSGRRPALVLTRSAYNNKTGLAVCCPVTSVKKGYVFEVELPAEAPVHGVVLVDHVRNLSFANRNCERIGAAPEATVETVAEILSALIGA